MGDKNFKWWAGGGSQPETYAGPFDTREEALQRGRADYPEGHFTICEADKETLSFNMFDAGRLLEDFEEHNLECWGEDGINISLTSQQDHDLEQHMAAALKDWFEKSGETPVAWALGETRTEEYFPPVDEPAGA